MSLVGAFFLHHLTMIRLSLLTTVLLNFTKTSQGTKFDQFRAISNLKTLSKPSKFVQLSKPLNSGVKRPSSTSSKYLSNRQIDESTCNITQFFDKKVRIESVDNPGFYVLTLNEQELWIKHAPVSSSRSNSGSDFGSNINNAIDLEKYAEATLFKVTRHSDAERGGYNFGKMPKNCDFEQKTGDFRH